MKTDEGWKWIDEAGNALTRKGIGGLSSWCLGDSDGSWPKADPETCLNLDREGHGLPLFYGLPCNFAKQHVLCTREHGSRSLQAATLEEEAEKSVKAKKEEEGKFSFSGRRSMGPSLEISRSFKENDDRNLGQYDATKYDHWFDGHNFNEDSTGDIFANFESDNSTDSNSEFKLLERKSSVMSNSSKHVTRLADLDAETKKFLGDSGYNFIDTDVILGLELELVDLNENSTIIGEAKGSIYKDNKKC